MELDDYAQPVNKAINSKRNFEKAFHNLLGIVNGIQADINLTSGEVYFLKNWLQNNDVLSEDPDVYDLFDAVETIASDGVLTASEKEDLSLLLSDFIEFRDDYQVVDVDLSEVIKRSTGIFAGISADGIVSEEEVQFLKAYLDDIGKYKEHWPLSAVNRAVDSVLSDGFISGAEREFLLSVLNDVNGGAFLDDGLASGKTTTLPIDDVDSIDFNGKFFCFTGRLSWGDRKKCGNLVTERGGIVLGGVTRKVDYLVVGPASSRDWFNTSYGRKIEKAVYYRDVKKLPLKIISEACWLRNI